MPADNVWPNIVVRFLQWLGIAHVKIIAKWLRQHCSVTGLGWHDTRVDFGRRVNFEPRWDDDLGGGTTYVLLPSSWTRRMNSFSHQQHCHEKHKWRVYAVTNRRKIPFWVGIWKSDLIQVERINYESQNELDVWLSNTFWKLRLAHYFLLGREEPPKRCQNHPG
jgi:hypothetical protein